jgi:uncharacterized protein (TIGR03437 family)
MSSFLRFTPATLGALFCLAAFSPSASAQVTLGLSNQKVILNTIGGNVLGEGQSIVTWGACVYDGTNTTCTLSGPFTGLANGGTYNFVLTYPGNGTSPLTAISNSPGNDQTFFSLSKGSFVTSLTETNGSTITFYDPSFFYSFVNPTCTPTPNNCSVGQLGLTQGATITGPVSGTMTTIPVIRTALGVISAGAYGAFPSIAPATWMEIYGTNLANVRTQTWAGTDFKGNLAPTALGGTTVTVAGIPAYIDFVSPEQVNAQVPSGVPSGPQPVVVTTAGGTSVAYTIQVNPVQPGLLAPASFTINSSQYVVALLSNTLTYVLPVPVTGVTTARVKPGQSITLYGVGFGPVTPNTPAGQIVSGNSALTSFQVFFGGVAANVTYAGLAPGYVGLYQFNVVVPNVAASDTVPLTFMLNGAVGSQTLVIPVQN